MSFIRTLRYIILHPLNRRRKARALLRFLKWQIGSRLVPGDVIYDWVNGARFIVRPGETGLTQNIYCGLQEYHEMAYVLHVLRPDDLFIDVGANAGAYTILACAARGAKGICFEPVPSTFERLMGNIQLNDLSEHVKAYNIGLADTKGELTFTSGLNATNHVVGKDEIVRDVVKVEVHPLDAMLAGESPVMIKIDVEGAETLVIKGMPGTLRRKSLHSVIMELNENSRRYGFDHENVIDTMVDHGFRTYRYEPCSRSLQPLTREQIGPGNVLFLRNEDLISERLAGATPFMIDSLEI
jgi:FkbM family methyltransferase